MKLRKIMALILAICMVLSTMGNVAFAAPVAVAVIETAQEVTAYAQETAVLTEGTVNSTFGTNELSAEAASMIESAVFPEDDTTGEGDSEEDIILINTAEELAELRDNVNAGTNYYEGKYVKLNADIDLGNTNWTPIGSASADHGFMGNFDGNGHTIFNLTIEAPALDGDGYAYAGLFGVTEGTDKDNQNIIKNLTVENVTISTTGHIVAAAIAYPYYTIVENVKVCGNIDITGGDYTAGVLAYTRRCVDASDLFVEGAAGSTIGGGQVVGGIISDIQMNGGLIANYSNFNASGVTISGTKNVGGISGIIASQTLDTCSVKDVTLDCDDARVGTVAGCLGGVSTISDATVENVSGASALIGGTYDDGKSVEAKIGDTYYATLAKAFETAENGDTVTLLSDIELNDTLVIGADDEIILDLNGYTINQEKACTASYSMIENKGNLTITGNGTISFTDTGAGDANFGWGSYTLTNRGTLVVENGIIENLSTQNPGNGQPNVHMYCAIQQADGSVTINDGKISTPTYRSIRVNKGDLVINGGEFVGQVWLQPNQGNTTLEVTGGTFAPAGNDGSSIFMTNAGENYTVSSADISGGTFTTKIGATDASALAGSITGGEFTETAKNGTNSALISSTLEFGEEVDGYYGLVAKPVVEMNGVPYTSIYDALDALPPRNSANIKVLNDFVITHDQRMFSNYSIVLNAEYITLDLNGKTITFDYTGNESTVYASIALYNQATLRVIDSSEEKTGTLYSKHAVQGKDGPRIIWITSAGSATIDGGRFISEQGDTMFYTSNSNKDIPTTLTINDGYFEHTIPTNGTEYRYFNQQDGYQKQIITVNGGIFAHNPTDSEIAFGDGFKPEQNADGSWGVVEDLDSSGTWGGIDWKLNKNGTLTIAPTEGEPVADKNAPTKRTYEVGEWRETVVYKSNGSASAIGGAPYDMKAVKKLIIEEGVTKIGSFSGQFPNLTGEVVIPSTVTYIGQEAFHKAPITSLVFAEGGTGKLCIANGAFKKTLIEEVILPKDRSEIHVHHWAFGGSEKLEKAYIPANVTKAWGGEHVDYFDNFNAQTNVTWAEYGSIFTGCSAMKTIEFENEEVRDLFFANGRQSTADDYISVTVGLTAYSNFDDAFAAAKDSDTITLRKSVKLDKTYKVEAGKTITLDLNGKTITGKDNNTSGNFYLFDNRGNLTIKGNGKITLTAVNNREWNASSVVVANNPGGKLTIENGTIEHLGGTDMAYGIDNLTNGKGTYAETIVNGGTIKSTYRGIRQFLNGIEAQNILTVNGGTVEGANKSIWMQDPSTKANTGKLTVADGAALNGDVYLFVTAGSTEWPVEVSIAKSAVNGEVLSANVPAGYEVIEENGYYGIEVTTADVYTVEAIADKTEVRYNNGNPDSFTVKYVVTGGNVAGAMAQFKYDTDLFICEEDSNATGRIRMNSMTLTTDANGKTLLKELHFTVKKNVDVNTTYTFTPEYVQVVSDEDAAGSGAQNGYVENVKSVDVTVVAQYDVTLPTDNTLEGNTYVDQNAEYSAIIKDFDENKTYTITYTMGGVEQPAITVTKDNVDNGGFVIENVTGDIVFTDVNSKLNYELILLPEAVSGYTLVLVKDGVSAGYTYNGDDMFAVKHYVGLTSIVDNADREEFIAEDGVDILEATSVRAILIKGGVTLDEARNAITVSANTSSSLDNSNYDINGDDAFWFSDAATAHYCYKDRYTLYENMSKLNWYLNSDVNIDFVIDTDDYDDTVEAFWATLD